MKKLFCLFCAFFLAISLPACSGDNKDSPAPEVSSSVAPKESENPFLQAEFLTDTVYSGSGKAIGTYGYITMKKSTLPDFYTEEFSAYFTEFANTKVRDSGLNWVSIIFDDGTGFCFTGSNTAIADYGNVDNEGCITAQLGTCIVSSSGAFEYEEIRTRSIPNPTIMQEALVPNNSFEPVPSEVFSTPAAENGLGDMAFYVEGKVSSRLDVGGYDTVQVATENGDLYVSAVLVQLPELSEGSPITVYFVYTGWADSLSGPCGAYVYSE